MRGKSSLLLLVAIVGCGISEDGELHSLFPDGMVRPQTKRDRLESRRATELSASGEIGLTASSKYDGRAIGTITLPITSGRVGLRADTDGRLVFDSLEVGIQDVVISATALPPTGLHLTGIRLSLRGETVADETTWTGDGKSAEARVDLSLLLDWSIQGGSGQTYPLGTQSLGELPVTVSVTGDGSSVAVSVRGEQPGVFWDWAGLIQFADLHLSIEGN